VDFVRSARRERCRPRGVAGGADAGGGASLLLRRTRRFPGRDDRSRWRRRRGAVEGAAAGAEYVEGCITVAGALLKAELAGDRGGRPGGRGALAGGRGRGAEAVRLNSNLHATCGGS